MTSTSTKSKAEEQGKVKRGASLGVDGPTVPGHTRARVSDSSPTPEGASPFLSHGEGSRSCPEPWVGQGGDCHPSSLDTCDQVGIFEGLSSKRAKGRDDYKQALVEALHACGRGSEGDRVAHCGEDFKVGKCLDCGACPAFPITCDHRLCPECAGRRGAILVREHREILKRIHYPKMLTLTFLSVEHLDKAFIKWARKCLTRLRHRKVFAGCWGGIYSFEVTHSVEYGWHLHIHSLIGSSRIDQAELSREWEQITGACVVDIRAVRGDDKWDAIKEVVKYPAKAASFLGDSSLVNEFLVATERVNMAYGFGALYRVRTRRHSEAKMRCPICGGSDISFGDGFGFCVPKIAVKRVKGGYLWRPPPGGE